jgi:hypothetical protein
LLLITRTTTVKKYGVLHSGKGIIEIEPALPATERVPMHAASRRGRHTGRLARRRTARRGRTAPIDPRVVGPPLRTAIHTHSPRATRLTHAGWPHRPAPPDLWHRRRTPPRRATLGAHALTLDRRACGREPPPQGTNVYKWSQAATARDATGSEPPPSAIEPPR